MSPVSSVLSWFFSSLGWKVPMPRRSFSDRISRLTLHVLHHFLPVAAVILQQIAVDLAAEGADIAVQADLAAIGQFFVDRVQHVLPRLARDQQQRLFVHRAFDELLAPRRPPGRDGARATCRCSICPASVRL